METKVGTDAPYVLGPGEGDAMSWFDATLMLKAAGPGIGVVEVDIASGNEPPPHIHTREDEWFYVLEGEATFHVGDEKVRGTKGSFVFLPREIPHTFTVESGRLKLLQLSTPPGLERMFELAPKTPEEAMQALEKYGIRVAGPPPGQG